MSISFDGIGEVVATFRTQADCAIKPGDVVCVTGDGEVGLGASGDLPCGVAVSVSEDGYAGVQLSGLVSVFWSGSSAPAPGWESVSADGKGALCVTAQNGLACLVLEVDEEAKSAVVKL